MVAVRPQGWSPKRFVGSMLAAPVVFSGYALVAASQDRGAALAVAFAVAAVVNIGVYIHARWLRGWFGYLTGVAALALLATVITSLIAALSPRCPSGTAVRCEPREVFEAGFAGFLIAPAVAVLIGLPFMTYRAGRGISRAVAKRRDRRLEPSPAPAVQAESGRVKATKRTATPPKVRR